MVLGALEDTEGRIERCCAWLPTRSGVPVPSNALIAPPPASQARVRLEPWWVTTLPLRWDELRWLLEACLDRGESPLCRGVLAGTDLRWWSELLRFAVELVASGTYLPQVCVSEADQCRFEARWEPIFEGVYRERLGQLGREMPSAARCLELVPERQTPEGFPETESTGITEAFIRRSLDRMVREAQAEGSTPRRRVKARGKNSSDFESVHDAWLHALRSDDARIPWQDRQELEWLVRQVGQWSRPIELTTRSPWRLCFRLEEPPEEQIDAASAQQFGNDDILIPSDGWTVRYLLQPHQDPSLLVPVGEVWRGRSRSAKALAAYTGDIREYLLTALGQASGLCPPVAAGLESPAPWGITLNVEQAHEFFTRHAPALEAAGFGVLLPAWWTGSARRRLSARAKVKSPKMQGRSGLTLQSLANVEWELALGDRSLSLEELEQLANMKVPLVRVRGAWVELDPEQLEEALSAWNRKAPSELPAAEILRLALGADTDDGKLQPEAGRQPDHDRVRVSAVEADGWIGALLQQLLSNGAPHKPADAEPPVLQGTLRPYQLRGYAWLRFLRQWGLGACLADDMGLGKTLQTLALVASARQDGETRPTLVVCPTSVINNWRKEAERFAPDLSVLVHHGFDRPRKKEFVRKATAHDIVVTGYDLLRRDSDFLCEVSWSGVVLDEAQNVKNPEAKQSRAARSLPADCRIALTGTPVENHVGDLWSIMEFLNPGLLGTQAAFKRRFFTPIQRHRDADAMERLRRITGPFILRRLKTDPEIAGDLPEKMEMKTYCTLTREQASLYAAVLEDLDRKLSDAEGIERKGLVLATITKLKQVCNHPAQFLADGSAHEGRSGKLARLEEMLAEVIEAQERALVFTQYAEMGGLLKRDLQELFGREVLFLHGGVSRAQRDRLIEQFQEGENACAPSVFVLSLKAGGTGLNLTRANHVFHYDRWWNPSVENQATDRAFRIGQTRKVQVYKFLCAGTLEERIDELIEGKTAVAEQVIGTGEAWLTELSDRELKEILALDPRTVGD